MLWPVGTAPANVCEVRASHATPLIHEGCHCPHSRLYERLTTSSLRPSDDLAAKCAETRM